MCVNGKVQVRLLKAGRTSVMVAFVQGKGVGALLFLKVSHEIFYGIATSLPLYSSVLQRTRTM